jgi:hypothetical protein
MAPPDPRQADWLYKALGFSFAPPTAPAGGGAAVAASDESAPNIGACVQQGAAFESACLTFAGVVSAATRTQVGLTGLMKALDAGGDDLVGWVSAVAGSGAALATGYAALDSLGDLIACMSQDAAADADTLSQLKLRQAALQRALAAAKAALGQGSGGEESAPNIGGCVKQGAAFESACLTFAGILSAATKTQIDLGGLMAALDGDGNDLVGWLSAVAGSGAALATGYAALDRLGDLVACMTADAAADAATLDSLKRRRGVLADAIARAKTALGQSGDGGETAPNIGGCVAEGAAFESAILALAELLSEATGTGIDLPHLMTALDGSGDDLLAWLTAVSGSGAAIATAYAARDRMAALIDCMGRDAAADADTLAELKKRLAVLNGALARARQGGSGTDAAP